MGQQVRGEADQQVRQARAELEIAEVTIARMEAEADQAAQQLDVVQGQLVLPRRARPSRSSRSLTCGAKERSTARSWKRPARRR